MTRKRLLLALNFVGVVLLLALTQSALEDRSSLAGRIVYLSVLALGMTPAMQALLKSQGRAPERWWFAVAAAPGVATVLWMIEQGVPVTDLPNAVLLWPLVVLAVVLIPIGIWWEQHKARRTRR